jgi:uncharacterized membrane protein
VLLFLGFAAALLTANWSALRSQPGRVHLVAGGAVACLLLWLMNLHLVDGLRLHFLGMTTLTLVVGWSFAVIGASAALLAFYLLQGVAWSGFGASAVFTVLVPATLSWLLARLLYRPRLRHPFIYILGAGFAGGGLVILFLALLALGLFAASGMTERVTAMLQWWPLLFLVMFSEGFINGMCVSALAIFYPDWVKTFDDRFYLGDE